MKRLRIRIISFLLLAAQLLQPAVALGSLGTFSPVDSFQSPHPHSQVSCFQQEALSEIAIWFGHTLEDLKLRSSQVREEGKRHLENTSETTGGLSREEIEHQARADFFLHNDAIDFVSHVAALSRNGILSLLKDREQITLSQAVQYLQMSHEQVNSGYIRIGLRLLADQGWVTEEEENDALIYRLTPRGRRILNHPGVLAAYERAASFVETELSTVEDIEINFPFVPSSHRDILGRTTYENWIQEALAPDAFHIPDLKGDDAELIKGIKTQLWGTLLGPTAAALAFHHILDVFDNGHRASFAEVELWVLQKGLRMDRQRLRTALDLLTEAGWLLREGPLETAAYQLTLLGKASLSRAGSYGVPVSYLPMFAQIDTLYFGQAEAVFLSDEHGHERHVARRMNIFGSKAAHEAHFKRFIPKLAELFDNDDFENQPEFIADMGAGEGAFLVMAYDYIKNHTKRGQHLAEHPLWIVGADCNLVALETMRQNFQLARIETFLVLAGDINDPEGLAEELQPLGLDPMAGVHTSTFLIHNRPWLRPSQTGRQGDFKTGAFVAPLPGYAAQGYAVSNGDVDQNLLDWIARQKLYLERFGMFFIELHSAPADVTARNQGVFAGTSYDATHFTSGQYIIPIPHFLKLMDESGMELQYLQPMPKPKQDGLNVPNGLYYFRARQQPTVSVALHAQAQVLSRTALGSSLALWIVSLFHRETASLRTANLSLRAA